MKLYRLFDTRRQAPYVAREYPTAEAALRGKRYVYGSRTEDLKVQEVEIDESQWKDYVAPVKSVGFPARRGTYVDGRYFGADYSNDYVKVRTPFGKVVKVHSDGSVSDA